MNFMKLATSRYSVRKFSDKALEDEKLQAILEAGRIAPTAANNQPQRIYVLQSDKSIAKANEVSKCIYGAKTVLVVAYDANEDWKNPTQDGIHSGQQDASIVACHMMLAAEELGVASVWVNAFANDEVARVLGFPESERVVMMLPLGYAAEDAKPAKWHTDKKPLEETVRYL